MAHDGADMTNIHLTDLLALTEATLPEIAKLTADATDALRALVTRDG